MLPYILALESRETMLENKPEVHEQATGLLDQASCSTI